MTARGLEIGDVAHLFGNIHIATEVLSGKRPITQRHAKDLGKFFRVPSKLFE
jgi:antitoxin component HigA of HigAB toxin-antitoxin module